MQFISEIQCASAAHLIEGIIWLFVRAFFGLS